jgi:hypothetical protein
VNDKLVSADAFWEAGNVCSFLRDGQMSLIRMTNADLRDSDHSRDPTCEISTNMVRLCTT